MRIIVVIPTFYAAADDMTKDIRYQLALETCQEIAKQNIGSTNNNKSTIKMEAIIVDASPTDEIRDAMRQNGSIVTTTNHNNTGDNDPTTTRTASVVRVVPQTYKGKKGAALREGIALAVAAAAATTTISSAPKEGENYDDDVVIAFQEPEKVGMIQYWPEIATKLMVTDGDICVPQRSTQSFHATYPIEQYHSESFANLYLDSLAQKVGFPCIDWTCGPIAFRASLAHHWLDYEGDLWNMQIVPMVRAQRWHGAKVIGHEIDYQHPFSMKNEELGQPQWGEKRLFQLNFLFEHVGKALKEKEVPKK